MQIYNIISVICFALMTVYAVYVLAGIFFRNHAERVTFLRGFKKGKCAILYVVCIPLYCMGKLYTGAGFMKSLFVAIEKVVGAVVLKYDIGTVEQLMTDNAIYRVTVYYSFILIALNALLFTFSLINQYIWGFFKKIEFFLSRKDKLILIGNNRMNISIYRSAASYSAILLDKISDKDGEVLYAKKINYASAPTTRDLVGRALGYIQRFGKTKHVFVINTGDDTKNIDILNRFIDYIRGNAENSRLNDELYGKIKIYVYGDPRYLSVYEDAMAAGRGMVQYLSRHQQVAMDFVSRYPLSAFMDSRHIDYKSSLVRPNIDINVILIGFGKCNQQIFLTSVANNQFITEGDTAGSIKPKPVKYHIFDRADSQNNKNLNHNYYRLKNEIAGADSKEYLPFPDFPAEEDYHKLDINSPDFYNEIKKIITEKRRSVNFVVTAFGTDLENIDMAKKLCDKRREWGIKNLVIFSKVRDGKNEGSIEKEKNCFFIGNEEKTVYNIENIVGDSTFRMSMMRAQNYNIEYGVTHYNTEVTEETVRQCRREAIDKWYLVMSQTERDSNLFGVLSLRSKLLMMGIDYCRRDDPRRRLTEEEYLSIYAGDDRPEYYDATVNGKKICRYSLDFKKSRRGDMAELEHYRWNSYMVSRGIVPATREQIRDEQMNIKKLKYDEETGYPCVMEKYGHTNGKNYRLRRHGNLTTFEGLTEFRKIISERDGTDELENDVIKYDYQLLDDAYWLLTSSGYKMVRRCVRHACRKKKSAHIPSVKTEEPTV